MRDAMIEGARAALFKYGTTIDVWHDLSPLARRALSGAAVGAAGGAVADSDHRGRGALLGGFGGAGLGAGYNKLRPIIPMMPGEYEATLYPRVRTHVHDYTDVLPVDAPSSLSRNAWSKRQPRTSESSMGWRHHIKDFVGGLTSVQAMTDFGDKDLAHLTRQDIPVGVMEHLVELAGSTYRPEFDVEVPHPKYDTPVPHPHEAIDPLPAGTALPRANVYLGYEGPLEHDSSVSPEVNEVRRRIRIANRRGVP